MRGAAAPYADQGDIQLVTRSILPAQGAAAEDNQSGAGGGFNKIASLHRDLRHIVADIGIAFACVSRPWRRSMVATYSAVLRMDFVCQIAG